MATAVEDSVVGNRNSIGITSGTASLSEWLCTLIQVSAILWLITKKNSSITLWIGLGTSSPSDITPRETYSRTSSLGNGAL